MRISIRTIGILTATLAAILTAVCGSITTFRGPLYREPILSVLIVITVLLAIPAGVALTAASVVSDQRPERKAVIRGGLYSAFLLGVLVFLLYLLTPAVR